MSDNENNNNDLMPEGGSSPPTDQVSQTDAPAVGSENNDTSSAEEKEEKPQGPSTDNDKEKDESQGQETEGGEESNKENKNDFSETAKKVGKSLTEKYNELLEAKKNDNKKDSLGDQMKSLVILDQNARVNTFSGVVHTARQGMGVGNIRSR